MSAKGWPWDALDLPRAPETTAEVRRAYAKRLKTIDQAKDIAGFEALRKAYEAALQRVEQKAQKAAAKAEAKAIAAPSGLNDLGSVDGAAAPSIPEPDRGSLPDSLAADEGQPATLPDPPPIQSAEDRLRLRLNLLSETNILMSPNAQVQAILDEPEFQSPELEPMLRHGLAEYIRSQLLWNHLNEPYLRHPGVTADLLKSLDARFGWLSDYTAFRRDFWGDTHILEAMVDAAEIDRTPQHGTFETKQSLFGTGGSVILPFGLLAFMYLARSVIEASQGAAPDSAIAIFANLMIGAIALCLSGLGLFILYGVVAANSSRRIALLACAWACVGITLLLLANGSLPGFTSTGWPLSGWVIVSLLTVGGLFVRWAWLRSSVLVDRLRNRN